MTGQEKDDLLIQVTTWECLTVCITFLMKLTNLFVVGCAIIVTGTINTARKNANDIFIRAMENNTSDWNISPILFNSSQSNINLLSAD
jgi:hypothetical protein